jgi:hypothetical protein
MSELTQKFMKQANIKEKQTREQEEIKKIEDASKWTLKDKINKKALKSTTVAGRTIGYSELTNEEIVGRRSWGKEQANEEIDVVAPLKRKPPTKEKTTAKIRKGESD